MHVSQTDRRAGSVGTGKDLPAGPYGNATHVVRQGIVIQASLGTRSAVEYLKQHGIHGAVIHRVLMGEHMRSDDGDALAQARHDLTVVDDPRM